jgi:acyl-CoA synthetase (AMP-forming)/AMP-acid ligase II
MHLAHFITRSARLFPARPLWITPNAIISYADGIQRINGIANSFLSMGKQRDRVVVISSNRFEAFEVYLAAQTAGMTPAPLNPKLHIDEVSFLLTDSGASFFVFSPEFADLASALRPKHPAVKHWLCFESCESFEDYSALLSGESSTPKVLVEPDDVAWLFYTSGTTGKPKGVKETHRNLVSVIEQMRLGLIKDANENDRLIHFAPLAHATTTVGLLYLSVGAAQILPGLGKFDPPKVLHAIEQFKATASFMAPTMIQMLLQHPDVKRYDVSSLRDVVCGGAPMYAEILRQAIEVFGPIFSQQYGQSEAPAQCGMSKSDYDISSPDKLKRLASVGREYPAVLMRIVGQDGNEAGPNVEGEMTVRGNIVTTGYWNREEATAEVLRDGWLHTGDVGYRDEEGYIFITDRVKDMIISGGSNIYPREVEEVLLRHHAVAEVCVVGVPDSVWGESVKAVVVLHSGVAATEDELIDFCRDSLASYKKPKSVDFVDELPKSAFGKVLKKDVKSRYWKAVSRAI